LQLPAEPADSEEEHSEAFTQEVRQTQSDDHEMWGGGGFQANWAAAPPTPRAGEQEDKTEDEDDNAESDTDLEPVDAKEKWYNQSETGPELINRKVKEPDESEIDHKPIDTKEKRNAEASQALYLGGKAAEGQGVPSSQTGSRGSNILSQEPLLFLPPCTLNSVEPFSISSTKQSKLSGKDKTQTTQPSSSQRLNQLERASLCLAPAR
jgi:hypothetical protein